MAGDYMNRCVLSIIQGDPRASKLAEHMIYKSWWEHFCASEAVEECDEVIYK